MADLHFLENELIEHSVIALGIIIASFSLVKGYLKAHKNLKPIILAAIGFIALLANHQHHSAELHWQGYAIIAFGGAAIAFAHYLNWQLIHQADHHPIGGEKC